MKRMLFSLLVLITVIIGVAESQTSVVYGINPGGFITNTAIGSGAMVGVTTNGYNTAFGNNAVGINTSGTDNTGVGANALEYVTSAGYNTAFGAYALSALQSGSTSNTAMGFEAGSGINSVGTGGNTLIGFEAGTSITQGGNNAVLSAGSAGTTVLTTGSSNVLIGTSATCAFTSSGQANTISVCTSSTPVWSVTGAGTPATAAESFTGTISFPNVTTGTNADFVCMASGEMLTLQTSACTISSKRFKEHLIDMRSSALPTIGGMTVASFNMKPAAKPNPDPNYGSRQIGLIAENIAEVAPECAIYENDMKTPKSYRQECVIALLVKSVQEQQREIDHLRRHRH